MLVLLTCAVVALETLPLDDLSVRLLSGVERIANVVFFVEYLLRFYSLNCRPRVLLRKLMIIDFVACLPLFFAPTEGWALQVSQLLRVARVLRLQRAIEREDFTKLFTRNKSRRTRAPAVVVSESQLKAAQIMLTVFTLLYATSSLLYAAESQVNPNFSNFFESFYFSVVAVRCVRFVEGGGIGPSLTTVGLGDITPITPLGRAIACGSVLSGAFLVPLQLGSLARATMSEMSRPNPTAPPPAVPPNSLLAQLGDYGMVDLDAADSAAAPPPPAAALAAAPPGVVPRPLATAAAAVVAVPAAAAVAAATAAGPASRAWNAAFMDAPCNSCGLRVHQLDARYCRLCGTVLQSPPRV
ncbi:hypothetical protein I4F81_004300 [Pyropia yezoensis]|uniref:Uncharacterized protein n=1 Tax=Pyropia yezoensis TaxID=2788 RepID=A0ACC3BUT6_PYRYE|nr:hypothetical protein I4F81_004300 [Neopyropia yezoensis]